MNNGGGLHKLDEELKAYAEKTRFMGMLRITFREKIAMDMGYI